MLIAYLDLIAGNLDLEECDEKGEGEDAEPALGSFRAGRLRQGGRRPERGQAATANQWERSLASLRRRGSPQQRFREGNA